MPKQRTRRQTRRRSRSRKAPRENKCGDEKAGAEQAQGTSQRSHETPAATLAQRFRPRMAKRLLGAASLGTRVLAARVWGTRVLGAGGRASCRASVGPTVVETQVVMPKVFVITYQRDYGQGKMDTAEIVAPTAEAAEQICASTTLKASSRALWRSNDKVSERGWVRQLVCRVALVQPLARSGTIGRVRDGRLIPGCGPRRRQPHLPLRGAAGGPARRKAGPSCHGLHTARLLGNLRHSLAAPGSPPGRSRVAIAPFHLTVHRPAGDWWLFNTGDAKAEWREERLDTLLGGKCRVGSTLLPAKRSSPCSSGRCETRRHAVRGYRDDGNDQGD